MDRHFRRSSALGQIFGASWTPSELQLVPLGCLLEATWGHLGASWAQLGASCAPLGPNLALQVDSKCTRTAHLSTPSRTPSATWRLLGATWRLLCPNWLQKPDSKCNLAPLGSIFGALATLRIELSPTRELDFHVFALLPCKSVFSVQLARSWPQLGAYRGASEPHLAALGRLLDSIWSLLGASEAQLGASWAAPERL